jgi:hypothetical protein
MEKDQLTILANILVTAMREAGRIGLDQPEYLSTKQASCYTGFSKQFFDIARHRNAGPPYIKLDHAVRYKRSVLDEWMLARQRTPGR